MGEAGLWMQPKASSDKSCKGCPYFLTALQESRDIKVFLSNEQAFPYVLSKGMGMFAGPSFSDRVQWQSTAAEVRDNPIILRHSTSHYSYLWTCPEALVQ